MKLKRGILLAILTVFAIGFIGSTNIVQAADTQLPSIVDPSNEGNLPTIVDPSGGNQQPDDIQLPTIVNPGIVVNKKLNLMPTGYKVNERALFKIHIDGTQAKESFYCIKGGPGFGSGSSAMGTSAIVATDYTNGTASNGVGNLRYRDNIKAPYSSALPQNATNYQKLMWVLDHIYVPAKDANDQERANNDKKILLDAVEQYVKDLEAQYGKVPNYSNTSIENSKLMDNIEDTDIFLVQQLAIWHYTNSDSYHNNTMPAFSIDSSANWARPFFPDKDEQDARIHACNALFDYFINAVENYDYTQTGDATPAKFGETNVAIKTEGNRKIIGPYSIEKVSDVNYTLDYTLTDGAENPINKSDVTFTNANGTKIADTVKELAGKGNFYISIPSTINTKSLKFHINGSFMATTITYWGEINTNYVTAGTAQPVVQVEKENKNFEDEKGVQEKEFDLALRKFITSIAGKELTGEESRVPTITAEELTALKNKNAHGVNKTTANKTHKKDAKTVKTGDKVVYTIRIYNEGEVDGWATEVTDHLPTGLQLVPANQSTINKKYGWTSSNGKDIKTNYLAGSQYKIDAFNGTKLDYEDIQIECLVIAEPGETSKNLKNVAEITGHKDINGNTGTNLIDRDSVPNSLTTSQINNYGEKPNNYQDDDDFEHLILEAAPKKEFDLSLRKFIIDVKNPTTEKSHVLTSREPKVDVSPLLEGKTTANYNHTKVPVGVLNGDIVTYTIRVYNEGKEDGYITEITDHLPPQLEFIVDDELNAKYGWTIKEGSNGRTVVTNITSPNTTHSASRDLIYVNRMQGKDKVLLKAFSYEKEATLDYIDVQIRCRVKENIDLYQKITNIAEISGFTDSEGHKVIDRDSKESNVTLPKDETLPEYKDKQIESGIPYIPGQQDDDDFEKLKLEIFDLALRKFITGVSNGEKTTDITNRSPVFVKDGNNYKYEHTKTPVEVANGNTVIYTLRIFNEGNVAGYATKVKDDLPDGLEFLTEHSINTAFNWKMYKEDGTETKKVSEAEYIETDFLSKEKETEKGENLLKAFNPETMEMPDYKDIKIAFKVTEPNTSDRIIINQAQISEDSDEDGNPVDDVDSTPNEWKEGEDDQDIEKVKAKYFDLSLKKWVTESIVTVDGKTKITKSGHTGNENPEPPMKVEIQAGKINKTTVKFRFNIKVTNEGEIAGYATELIDYIPQGLKFVAKDNPKWKETNGKVTTDQLKDKLLKPGESATVDIVLTWINGKNNMGEKVNWAEINKDKNEYNSPDIDSTPGNNKKGEDDIDRAPVILTPATGNTPAYLGLVLTCMGMLTGGVLLIKKFVL